MDKFIVAIRKFFFAIKVIAKAVAAPLINIVVQTSKGEPITLGMLGFAMWRLLVWVAFLLCATSAIGVPAVIANLFLADLVLVGFQMVYFAVA